MKPRSAAGALFVVIGLVIVIFSSNLVGLSTVPACVSIYGMDPAVIQSQGSAVSSSAYFSQQEASSTYRGFTVWAGPESVGGGSGPSIYSWFVAESLTWGSVGSTGASWTANGWTNPSGGAVAVITWDPNIYFYNGQAYDLTTYLRGACIEGGGGSGSSTTSSQTTTSTTTTKTSLSSTSSTTWSTVTTSTTVSGNVNGRGSQSQPPNVIGVGIGGASLVVGLFLLIPRKRP